MNSIFSERGEKLSELKDTVFVDSETVTDTPENDSGADITEQTDANDTYEPVISDTEEDSVPTPEELIRESLNAVEKMKQELEEENAALDRRFAEQRSFGLVHSATKRRPVYVIGVISSAASLIFMGIALLISLATSPIGAYAAIRLSPVMLIFLGAEIIFAVVRKHSLRIKIDIRSIVIIVCLIGVSSLLSALSVVASAGTGERIYAEQRIQNMLASELHDTIARDYIKSVDIETQLFGEDAEMYKTPADLTDGDLINLTVNFSDAQMTIREFAKDCKNVIDDIHKLSYNFGTIKFIADDMVNHYVLDLDWHYQSGFNADKLAGLVNYFGDGISDTDIPDALDDDQ